MTSLNATLFLKIHYHAGSFYTFIIPTMKYIIGVGIINVRNFNELTELIQSCDMLDPIINLTRN